MIASIVPAGVEVADATGPLPGEALLPEEEVLVARAVGKRRAEFTTVRTCARIALGRLGLPPAPLLSGPKREPLWPAGRGRQHHPLRRLPGGRGRPGRPRSPRSASTPSRTTRCRTGSSTG